MGKVELDSKDIDEKVPLHWSALKRTWRGFCATTSIHGLKFTNEVSTNRIIRCIWWIITIVSFICSITMVITFYADYRSNPTRMNLENDHTPMSSLLFPSVTICSELQFDMEKAEQYISSLKLPSMVTANDIVKRLTISAGFFDDADERYDEKDIELMEHMLQLNNLTIKNFFVHLRWDCNDLLFRCRYRSQITPCAELFQVAHTFFGYCCAFNLNQTGIKFTNWHARSGLRDGLSLILYHNNSRYKESDAYSVGFKVLLDENQIFPSAHSVVKFVPLNEEVFAAVRPVETFCSEAVANLPIEERQCVFPDEMKLKYFRTFQGAHCELNCRVLNTLQYCDCMPYFIIHNRTKERVCSFKDLPCLVVNFAAIIGRFRNTQCSCPNECEMMDYDVQISSAELQLNLPTVDDFYSGLQKDFSVLHVFMNSEVYRRVRRDLLSSTVTLVSNLGSAFSLFVGMSMVSLIEIVYYFTVVLRKNYVQEQKVREKMRLERISEKSQQIEFQS